MEQYTDSLISRYRSAGVLVDTNLLLLLFVGRYDRDLVGTFKRTRNRGFGPADFDRFANVVVQFDALITTPHILTEVSNLMGSLTGRARDGCFELFGRSIAALSERRTAGATLAGDTAFVKVGVADTSILEAASRKTYLVFTEDAPLYDRLLQRGVDVVNYNHIRQL